MVFVAGESGGMVADGVVSGGGMTSVIDSRFSRRAKLFVKRMAVAGLMMTVLTIACAMLLVVVASVITMPCCRVVLCR